MLEGRTIGAEERVILNAMAHDNAYAVSPISPSYAVVQRMIDLGFMRAGTEPCLYHATEAGARLIGLSLKNLEHPLC